MSRARIFFGPVLEAADDWFCFSIIGRGPGEPIIFDRIAASRSALALSIRDGLAAATTGYVEVFDDPDKATAAVYAAWPEEAEALELAMCGQLGGTV